MRVLTWLFASSLSPVLHVWQLVWHEVLQRPHPIEMRGKMQQSYPLGLTFEAVACGSSMGSCSTLTLVRWLRNTLLLSSTRRRCAELSAHDGKCTARSSNGNRSVTQ
eukprot:1153221-Amphidinium_carterae.1